MKKNGFISKIAFIGAIFALSGCTLSGTVSPKKLSISDDKAFEYKVGEVFDSYIDNGGLTVNFIMSDNTTVHAEKGSYTYKVYDKKDSSYVVDTSKAFEKAGTYIVIVSKESLTNASETIIVNEKESEKVLTSISVSNYTNQVYVGDTYTFNGKVKATYSDGSTEDVTSKATIGTISTAVEGNQSLKISYTEGSITKETTVQIKVVKKATLSSISALNYTNQVYVGDTYTFDGKVNATYSDGSTKDVTSSATIGSISTASEGTKNLEISYTEDSVTKEITIQITVIKKTASVTLNSITLNPSAVTVAKGSTFVLADEVAVMANYSDGTNKNVTSEATCPAVSTSSVGTKTYTVSYTDKTLSVTKTASLKVTVEAVKVTSITLDPTSKTLEIGSSFTISSTVLPSNASNKTLTWTTSKSSVATVSNGTVKAVAAGTATITAKSSDGSNITATCSITVPAIQVTNISLSASTLNISIGGTSTLTATVSPSNASNKTLSWTSNATSVATVTSAGKITGVSAGSAVITAKSTDGSNIEATCSVTVSAVAVTSVSVQSTATVSVGKTTQLTATISPSNATNKNVSWKSSATSIATVSSSGLVTGVAAGTATITVTTADGNKTANCSVTVSSVARDAWTLLIYMCGADLESKWGLASGDIKEILSVSNQPDNVNIVIETGGAKSWSLGSTYLSGATSISSSKLSRWHVEGKKLVLDTTLTNASMGKASTLQSFVEYGINNYPAEKTGVIMWNHGGAMYGCCYDEKYDNDSLSNSEMKSAFSSALSSTGSSKLEFIGYDTCLTQVQDIAEFNSNYFNYMIASEEAEDGEGWDYDTWIDDVYDNKSTSTILTAIVDGFITDNGGQSSTTSDQTLSWLDLSAMSAYKTAFENFATAMKSQLSSKSVTKATFANWMSSKVKVFCVDSDEDEKYFCLFDVKDMINKISSNTTYNPGSSYITALNTAFSNLVKYSVAQKGAGNAYGIGCIYCQASDYSSDLKSAYTSSETGFTNWFNFLKTYSYLG